MNATAALILRPGTTWPPPFGSLTVTSRERRPCGCVRATAVRSDGTAVTLLGPGCAEHGEVRR